MTTEGRKFRLEPDPPKTPEPVVPLMASGVDARRSDGYWVPGCNETEVPFHTRTGYRLLYCWNPITKQHAYLDLGRDMILSDDEARMALGTY